MGFNLWELANPTSRYSAIDQSLFVPKVFALKQNEPLCGIRFKLHPITHLKPLDNSMWTFLTYPQWDSRQGSVGLNQFVTTQIKEFDVSPGPWGRCKFLDTPKSVPVADVPVNINQLPVSSELKDRAKFPALSLDWPDTRHLRAELWSDTPMFLLTLELFIVLIAFLAVKTTCIILWNLACLPFIFAWWVVFNILCAIWFVFCWISLLYLIKRYVKFRVWYTLQVFNFLSRWT